MVIIHGKEKENSGPARSDKKNVGSQQKREVSEEEEIEDFFSPWTALIGWA